MYNRYFTASIFSLLFIASACGQNETKTKMDFEKYDPVSTLKVPQHIVTHAKFPFIDVHNHQWNVPGQNIKELYGEMDSLNMKVMVNLSGKSYKETPGKVNGDFDVNDHSYLVRSLDKVQETGVKRLVFFTNISFVGFGEKDWTEKTVKELESDVKPSHCKGRKVASHRGAVIDGGRRLKKGL